MTENRKQHYLPKFYLKNFSEDDKQVCVYHLKSGKGIISPIDSTCQEKYFYGKDSKFEKGLSDIETYQAQVIKKIIETSDIEILSLEEQFNLLSFLILQYARTKEAKNTSEKWVEFHVEHYLKPLMKSHPELKKYRPEEIDRLKITVPNFYKYTMGVALSSIEGIFDLKLLLLINKTEKPLITSDAQVILNNIVKLKKRSMIGLFSPGLQIFCPLTDSIGLLLIDPLAYKIEISSDSKIDVINEEDIDNLNTLQILNCSEIVIFRNRTEYDYIKELHGRIKGNKIKKTLIEKKIKITPLSNGGYSEIVGLHTEGINYGYRFSFLKLNHKFNRRLKGLFEREVKTNITAMPVRNKELSQSVSDQTKFFLKKYNLVETEPPKK
jgi:hypothetical protein